MRNRLLLASCVALSACGGSGPEPLGNAAPPPGAQPTPATPSSGHSFVNPTETKTYQAQGTVQSFSYDYVERVNYNKVPVTDAQGNVVRDELGFAQTQVDRNSRTFVAEGQTKQLYTANAGTVRDPRISVSYDPRNAQFTLSINQDAVANSTTFQDPAHRTDFGGAREPQRGVPNLTAAGVRYLEVDNGSSGATGDTVSFFYQQPGTTTKYVTFAGFVRNRLEGVTEATVEETNTRLTTDLSRRTVLERATFVFGEQTASAAVPKTGSASFSGDMLASVINNPGLENGDNTYFQWMTGSANVSVDFAAGTVTTALAGRTLAPLTDPSPLAAPMAGGPNPALAIPAGAAFAASGTGRIDMVGTGGFTGQFSQASFTAGNTVQNVTIAGSTMDGAFYGPKADEVGATFRIVGGVPDQRVDIAGAFTGVKK